MPDFWNWCDSEYGSADDPLMVDSLKVVDAVLKVDTPSGPCWKRYNHDGYGQRDDGTSFEGWGVGRPWPLLTLERAAYELAAGQRSGATLPDGGTIYLRGRLDSRADLGCA